MEGNECVLSSKGCLYLPVWAWSTPCPERLRAHVHNVKWARDSPACPVGHIACIDPLSRLIETMNDSTRMDLGLSLLVSITVPTMQVPQFWEIYSPPRSSSQSGIVMFVQTDFWFVRRGQEPGHPPSKTSPINNCPIHLHLCMQGDGLMGGIAVTYSIWGEWRGEKVINLHQITQGVYD